MSYTTFKTKYVLHTFPDYSVEPAPSVYSPNFWLRNPMGIDARMRMTDYPKFKVKNKYSFITAQGVDDFNDLFDSVYGRVGSLWVPSWNRDFFLTEAIGSGDNHLHITDCSYETYYPTAPGTGRYVFVYVNDTNWYARKILSVFSPTQLILESSLGVSLSLSQVKYVCILYLMRFEIDELEWTFTTPMDFDMVAETEVEFIEVPHEYASLT